MLVKVSEAANAVGKHRRNIHQWINKGFLNVTVVGGGRRTVGVRYVELEEVVKLSQSLRQGVRTDVTGWREFANNNYTFTDKQLEIARKVFG